MVTVLVPRLSMPPPPLTAELPLNVELVTVTVPPLEMPPPSLLAELSLRIELVTVTVPFTKLWMPPPSLAELPPGYS